MQEISDEQVLYLADQRDGFMSQSERIGHARHVLVEIFSHRPHGEDVAQGLLRVLGQHVGSALQILHVVRQETQHQFLDFPFVLVVIGLHGHFQIRECRRFMSSRLTKRTDVAVKHGQELQRVQFLSLEPGFDVQPVTAQGHSLTGFHALPELRKDI